MATILIGLDDTDNRDSPGTGRLARELCAECSRRGMRPLGVTRHQFLVDERIPYTSHNSSACVAVESTEGMEAAQFAFDFVAERSADGSDPGVCIAETAEVTSRIISFGKKATREIVQMADAQNIAQEARIALRQLGGSGLGIIGALGAIGLRAEGQSGRFIDLPGLRDLPQRVMIGVFNRLGIRVVNQSGSRHPAEADVCDTLNWARPRLIDGRPVLIVQWSKDAWVPVDRKRKQPCQ